MSRSDRVDGPDRLRDVVGCPPRVSTCGLTFVPDQVSSVTAPQTPDLTKDKVRKDQSFVTCQRVDSESKGRHFTHRYGSGAPHRPSRPRGPRSRDRSTVDQTAPKRVGKDGLGEQSRSDLGLFTGPGAGVEESSPRPPKKRDGWRRQETPDRSQAGVTARTSPPCLDHRSTSPSTAYTQVRRPPVVPGRQRQDSRWTSPLPGPIRLSSRLLLPGSGGGLVPPHVSSGPDSDPFSGSSVFPDSTLSSPRLLSGPASTRTNRWVHLRERSPRCPQESPPSWTGSDDSPVHCLNSGSR